MTHQEIINLIEQWKDKKTKLGQAQESFDIAENALKNTLRSSGAVYYDQDKCYYDINYREQSRLEVTPTTVVFLKPDDSVLKLGDRVVILASDPVTLQRWLARDLGDESILAGRKGEVVGGPVGDSYVCVHLDGTDVEKAVSVPQQQIAKLLDQSPAETKGEDNAERN